MMLSTTKLIQGDQFVGFNVNPTTGDLVLRYIVARTDIPDANGRGITRRVMENNRSIAKGRPLIFAPNEQQGGTKGHTNTLGGVDPFKFELGRIVNIEPVNPKLLERINKNLIQTNSSSNNTKINDPKDLWAIDVIITNDQAKSVFLNPATSHLIPRYVSPSFIHKRNPRGDYSRVDEALLDHVAIVQKPTFNNRGIQIDGAAYGEVTQMSNACFGDKISCLNLLQTSSNKVVELDKCVSCPVQLRDRLTQLYINLTKDGYIVQTASSNNMSESNNANNTNTSTTEGTQNDVVTGTTTTTTTVPQSPNNTPLNQFFKSDESIQKDYGAFKGLFEQYIRENKDTVKNILIDANAETPTTNPQQQQNQQQNQKVADNLQTVENQQKETGVNKDEILKQLDIKEDDLRNMKTEDLKNRINEWKKTLGDVLERQTRTDRILDAMRVKEEKQRLANLLPKEAFTDERGFKEQEFNEVVSELHKAKLKDDYIKTFGVGLIALKNQQIKLNQDRKELKNKNPTSFGDSIKFAQAPPIQNQQQQQQST
jgi:ribosomal protein L29